MLYVLLLGKVEVTWRKYSFQMLPIQAVVLMLFNPDYLGEHGLVLL
jgi:hypothetical protein